VLTVLKVLPLGISKVVDGGEAETILTAKAGGGVGVSDALSIYGEISAAFDDTNSYGTKAGLKYRF
jgi:hypothetical protein